MISFDLTEEQQLLVDTAMRFAGNELRKAAREADESTQIPAHLIDTGWSLGIVPSNIPEQYGGFGAHSALNGVLAAEALAYGDLSAALNILAPSLAAFPILLCGSDEQKQAYLPKFCGEKFFAATAALVEPRILFDPRQPADHCQPWWRRLRAERPKVPGAAGGRCRAAAGVCKPGRRYAGIYRREGRGGVEHRRAGEQPGSARAAHLRAGAAGRAGAQGEPARRRGRL